MMIIQLIFDQNVCNLLLIEMWIIGHDFIFGIVIFATLNFSVMEWKILFFVCFNKYYKESVLP